MKVGYPAYEVIVGQGTKRAFPFLFELQLLCQLPHAESTAQMLIMHMVMIESTDMTWALPFPT